MAADIDSDPAVWPSVVKLPRQDGIDITYAQARRLMQHDLDGTSRVITLGYTGFDADTVNQKSWNNVPLVSQDLRVHTCDNSRAHRSSGGAVYANTEALAD